VRQNIFHLDLNTLSDVGGECVDAIRIASEGGFRVMADEDDLKAQSLPGVVNDFDKARHEIGPQPAIRFIEKQETSMALRIQRGESKDSKAHRKHVGHGPALAFHDVFRSTVALYREIDLNLISSNGGHGLENDWLLQNLLQRNRQVLLQHGRERLKHFRLKRVDGGGDFRRQSNALFDNC